MYFLWPSNGVVLYHETVIVTCKCSSISALFKYQFYITKNAVDYDGFHGNHTLLQALPPQMIHSWRTMTWYCIVIS